MSYSFKAKHLGLFNKAYLGDLGPKDAMALSLPKKWNAFMPNLR